MAINLDDKKAIVAEVQEAAKGAQSAVIADSRGVTVEAITTLRKQARENGVWMKVVRNTLARRALEGTDFECVSDTFSWSITSCIFKRAPRCRSTFIYRLR